MPEQARIDSAVFDSNTIWHGYIPIPEELGYTDDGQLWFDDSELGLNEERHYSKQPVPTENDGVIPF